MRVLVIFTDDDGNTVEGEATLAASALVKPAPKRGKRSSGAKATAGPAINLASPIRPFVKKHARDMGGAQKFALLLAHIAGGDTKKEVALATIQKQWSKLTGRLGNWNPAYTTRAKEEEWVDSPKNGTYVLLSGWKGIFSA